MGDDWEADGYRAIGRWVVEFSRLVGGMRANMENRLSKPDDDALLMKLAFGADTAGSISDAFFAMCRLVGELDAVENNIASQLQNEVDDTIKQRNKITHGDWIIGRGYDAGTAQTHLIRTYPNVRKPPYSRVESYTGQDLDKLSDRVGGLAGMVWVFGTLALRNGLLTASRGFVFPCPYRVSDVLIAENVPKNGKGGQVAMTGPKASDILG